MWKYCEIDDGASHGNCEQFFTASRQPKKKIIIIIAIQNAHRGACKKKVEIEIVEKNVGISRDKKNSFCLIKN